MKMFIKAQLFIIICLFCSETWSMETPESQRERIQQIQSCLTWKDEVGNFCGQGNRLMERAQQQVAACTALMNGNDTTLGALTGGMAGSGCTREQQRAVREIQSICNEAVSQCNNRCGTEANSLISRNTAPNYPLNDDINERNQIAQVCEGRRVESETETAAMDMKFGEILAGLAAIMQALGGNPDNPGTDIKGLGEDDPEDCENNPNADSLLRCKKQSNPGTRTAGLNGVANLNGKGGSGLGGLLGGVDTAGEPGGESKDNGSGSGSGNGFGTAGFGGFGSGGSGGGSGSGAGGAQKSGLNTDVQKWAGGGGYGSGGGGGGGRSGGGGARFAGASLNAPGGGLAGKAALNKKLGALKAQARMPASKGGANGPFEDNWSVVNKAYKKNSSSMFHQQ